MVTVINERDIFHVLCTYYYMQHGSATYFTLQSVVKSDFKIIAVIKILNGCIYIC